MYPVSDIVAGIFFGAEIEPGQFHRFPPACSLLLPHEQVELNEEWVAFQKANESSTVAPPDVDETGVPPKPIGEGEDPHLAGHSTGIPL